MKRLMVVAVLVGPAGCGKEPPRTSQEFLAKVAEGANKELPRQLDAATELNRVTAAPGVLEYHYRVPSLPGGPAARPEEAAGYVELQRRVYEQAKQHACATPQTRDELLAHGVVLKYTYRRDVDGPVAMTFNVAPADCGLPGRTPGT